MANDFRAIDSSGATALRVALVTDDRLLAEALERLSARDDDLVLFTCRDTREIEQPANVLLLDSRIEPALELCEAIARTGGPRVILLGAPDDDQWGVDAISRGARGVIVRSADPRDIVLAVRAVAGGVIWARRRVISAYIDRLKAAVYTEENRTPLLDERLSVREREIFRHAAAGLGNKELAARLAISEATVKVHLTHIFQKLGVRGRAELAAAYYGLIGRGPSLVRMRISG